MNLKLVGPVLALLLVLLCGIASYGWFTAHSKLSQAKSTIAVLEASVEAYRASAEQVQVVIQKSTAAKQEINNALESNQDWASTPVPDAVIAGLCKNSVCKAGEMSSSANQPKQ